MNNKQKSLAIIIAGLIGSVLSRWHGGGFFKSPKTIKNIVWSLPLGVASFIALVTVLPWYWATLGAWVAFGLCLAGKATGHGRVWHPWLKLDLTVKAERLEFLVFWLHGKVSDFTYKNIALGLIGLAAVSGAVLAIGYVNIWAGLIAALGGALGKPIGYVVGFRLDEELGNELAEFVTGFFAYGFVTLGLLLAILWGT